MAIIEKIELTPEDKIILDRLLSKLAGSLDGALDFWTLVCINDFCADRRAFILRQSEIQHALVVVLDAVLAEFGFSRKKGISDLLEQLAKGYQQLQNTFLTLAESRTISREEIHTATEKLVKVYPNLRETIRQLSQTVGVPVAYLRDQTRESEEYFQKILAGLYGQFCYQLDSEQVSAAGSSKNNSSCASS